MPNIPKKATKRPWIPERPAFENKPRKPEGLENFYSSPLWRKTRARILAKEPLCRMCYEKGLTQAATVVDHILPINKGGEKYKQENLQPLCETCHNRKSRFDAR